MNKYKDELAEIINLDKQSGSLAEALVDADVFVGVSVPGTFNHREWLVQWLMMQLSLLAPILCRRFIRMKRKPAELK